MLTKEILKRIDKYVRPFRVTSGKTFRLKDFDPGDTLSLRMDKSEAADLLARGSEWLAMEQDKLYAQDRWSLLLVFQAMDAAGKDARSNMSCRASIRRAARCLHSSNPQRRSYRVIFFGDTPRRCPREDESAF